MPGHWRGLHIRQFVLFVFKNLKKKLLVDPKHTVYIYIYIYMHHIYLYHTHSIYYYIYSIYLLYTIYFLQYSVYSMHILFIDIPYILCMFYILSTLFIYKIFSPYNIYLLTGDPPKGCSLSDRRPSHTCFLCSSGTWHLH